MMDDLLDDFPEPPRKVEPWTGEFASVQADERYVKFARRIIQRTDQNGDEVLTPAEWKRMLISPAKADANQDGVITVNEYAVFLQNRDRD